jgi:hypothetical protein
MSEDIARKVTYAATKEFEEKLVEKYKSTAYYIFAKNGDDPAIISGFKDYYFFINLYNAIQKRAIEPSMKVLRVFRGTHEWYMKDDYNKFFYINAFSSTTNALSVAKTFTGYNKKIYVYYAHPLARFMNIKPLSSIQDENEVLFSPYNRYLFINTRIVNGYEYKIYCVLPTDLEIPDGYYSFMRWISDIKNKTIDFPENQRSRLHRELAEEERSMKGGRVLLNATRRAESPLLSPTKLKTMNARSPTKLKTMNRRSPMKSKTMKARSPSKAKEREERWTAPLPMFPGKAPTKAEAAIIEQMKKLIENDPIDE